MPRTVVLEIAENEKCQNVSIERKLSKLIKKGSEGHPPLRVRRDIELSFAVIGWKSLSSLQTYLRPTIYCKIKLLTYINQNNKDRPLTYPFVNLHIHLHLFLFLFFNMSNTINTICSNVRAV